MRTRPVMTVAKQVFASAPPIINCDFHNVRIEKMRLSRPMKIQQELIQHM
jgi:hypothetical protein